MPIKSSSIIDWGKLSNAVEYYQLIGYKYIEVPWIVKREAILATIPNDAKLLSIENYGDLIGSAEQSFIQMMIDKELPPGKWVTLTPCFRDDKMDGIHQKHFMKVELIDTSEEADYRYILNQAKSLMNKYLSNDKFEIQAQRIDCNQVDLMLHDTYSYERVEIGSYGVRAISFNDIEYTWHYGTGLAEPRFSSLLEK